MLVLYKVQLNIINLRNIRHHILLITVNDAKLADKIRADISELYKKNMEAKDGFKLISPVVPSLINNFFTFFIGPDGSKEGYDLSDDGDRIREKTIKLLELTKKALGENSVNYVEFFYGDDYLPAQITHGG